MTPQQAIQLLDSAVSNMALSRADHVKLQEAVAVLMRFCIPTEEKEEEVEN